MSNKVTFAQLVEELAEKTNTSQTLSHDFVSSLTDLVIDSAVESGKASITNLGSFTVVDVAARNGVNPQTGEAIVIPAHQRLSFSPYKALENTVNAPFLNLEATIIEEGETESIQPKQALKANEEKEEKVSVAIKEDTGETEAKPPVFKNPEKEGESSRTTPIILGIVFFLIVIIAGLWFFVFRDTSTPEISQENITPVEQPTPPAEEPNPIPEEQEEQTDPPQTSNQTASDELPTETGLVEQAPLGTSSHIVGKDEWFYDIARAIYKTPNFWPLIFEANFTSLQDPDILKPGKKLTIPSIENAQNPTPDDRIKLAAAITRVSEAYANAGKAEKAKAYARMAKRFSN